MDTTVAVSGRDITKVFGDVVALDHVDVSVAQGQIHGLVGPNGAGKTTLLGLMLGLAGRRPTLAPVMWTTVGLAAVVAGMVSALIYGHDSSDGYTSDYTYRSDGSGFARINGPAPGLPATIVWDTFGNTTITYADGTNANPVRHAGSWRSPALHFVVKQRRRPGSRKS